MKLGTKRSIQATGWWALGLELGQPPPHVGPGLQPLGTSSPGVALKPGGDQAWAGGCGLLHGVWGCQGKWQAASPGHPPCTCERAVKAETWVCMNHSRGQPWPGSRL